MSDGADEAGPRVSPWRVLRIRRRCGTLQFVDSRIADQKIALRRGLRTRLGDLTPAARAAASRRLGARLSAFASPASARVVAGFMGLASEPLLTAFYRRQLAGGGRLALPLITGAGAMEFRLLPEEGPALGDPGEASAPHPALRRGPHGLWEPDPARCRLAAPGELDLVLVPGLGFAPGGFRLGRGGGFYDRWLAGLPAATRTVGLAFACQLCPGLPVEPHDRLVDHILTEAGWVDGARGSPAAGR